MYTVFVLKNYILKSWLYLLYHNHYKQKQFRRQDATRRTTLTSLFSMIFKILNVIARQSILTGMAYTGSKLDLCCLGRRLETKNVYAIGIYKNWA